MVEFLLLGSQQFLVLTLPVGGGRLRVETAAQSESPVARIVASYAGLAAPIAVMMIDASVPRSGIAPSQSQISPSWLGRGRPE